MIVSRTTIRTNGKRLSNLTAVLPLDKGMFAIVDSDMLPLLTRYKWFVVKSSSRYYATRKFTDAGCVNYIRLHRMVTNCPADLIVHHKNHLTLDCRRDNLELMTASDHNTLEKTR